MGNAHGSSASAKGEWKGPFSDEEYDCLTATYKDAIATAPCVADARSNLQIWFELPLPVTAPAELIAHCRQLGSALYDLCLHTRDADPDAEKSENLQLEHFVQGGNPGLTEEELSALMFACLVMAIRDKEAVEENVECTAAVAKALAHAALSSSSDDSQASIDDFVRWTGAQFPLLHIIFVSWLSRKSFAQLARPSYEPPRLSCKSDILSRAHFVALSTVTKAIQMPLRRLYTSAQDGLSFNRLSYHILGYSGPTLMVIQDTEGAIFGMFCDTEWKESSRFYGGHGCFLFRLAPDIRTHRVTASGANDNYMYLNSKGFALPRGLGMGGTTDKFRLFLSEDLDEGSYSTSKGLSFESGRLSSSEQFLIDAIEVWGCGGEDGDLGLKAHRQETADLINRARKVDKAQFAGSDFDKEFFLSKTFGHGTNQGRIAEDEH